MVQVLGGDSGRYAPTQMPLPIVSASAGNSSNTIDTNMKTTFTVIHAIHLTQHVKTAYNLYTRNLEAALGRLDEDILKQVGENPKMVADAIINKMQGVEGLILFQIYDHGGILNIWGKPRKAKQYLIGNPYTATLMSRYNISAALYAPLRVLVFEKEDQTVQIEYDLPSSLFGQFGIPEITDVGLSLDEKLERVLEAAGNKPNANGKRSGTTTGHPEQ
jgi:uncharacterized protein (DUF302 family)